MKFSSKWKKLENIILSEVTQTQKDKHVVEQLTQPQPAYLIHIKLYGPSEAISQEAENLRVGISHSEEIFDDWNRLKTGCGGKVLERNSLKETETGLELVK
ncbi:hypothetical protein STEG23_005989 [Scotinomys teguina]